MGEWTVTKNYVRKRGRGILEQRDELNNQTPFSPPLPQENQRYYIAVENLLLMTEHEADSYVYAIAIAVSSWSAGCLLFLFLFLYYMWIYLSQKRFCRTLRKSKLFHFLTKAALCMNNFTTDKSKTDKSNMFSPSHTPIRRSQAGLFQCWMPEYF